MPFHFNKHAVTDDLGQIELYCLEQRDPCSGWTFLTRGEVGSPIGGGYHGCGNDIEAGRQRGRLHRGEGGGGIGVSFSCHPSIDRSGGIAP